MKPGDYTSVYIFSLFYDLSDDQNMHDIIHDKFIKVVQSLIVPQTLRDCSIETVVRNKGVGHTWI
jgi:hypothetical protein